ncbi:dienelactone hydrolase family protein [bacterium]|nr:dienelactone hydrolase family protein [bacterium]
MHRLWTIVLLFFCLSVSARAQEPKVHARWYQVQDDSVLVQYVLPAGNPMRPAIIVLPDRFGADQGNVRAVIKVLARLGYRAYAMPLRSAPMRAVEGMPSVTRDSLDTALLMEVAVDITNEPGCSGKLGLLGFDIGANVAIDALSRFPFFHSAALFYPTGGVTALKKLLRTHAALQLHVAQFDPQCSLSDVNTLKEAFMEAQKPLHIFYYKEAHRFFINPQHADYHQKDTQAAWSRINKFFRQTL